MSQDIRTNLPIAGLTSVENVLRILDVLEKAGVPASIGGGWGIDALVGRQTRPHSDIDLCVPAEQSDAAAGALATLGFEMTVDERPTRFVMAGVGLGSIDLHPLRFLADGTARLAAPDGSEYVFPVGSLDANGTIGGQPCAVSRPNSSWRPTAVTTTPRTTSGTSPCCGRSRTAEPPGCRELVPAGHDALAHKATVLHHLATD